MGDGENTMNLHAKIIYWIHFSIYLNQLTYKMFLVVCVIAKFGDAPRLSPNGTFFSRFQKCNSSFRISPLHTAMLRCRGPSSEDLPRSAGSCGYYKVFLHDDYVRIVS